MSLFFRFFLFGREVSFPILREKEKSHPPLASRSPLGERSETCDGEWDFYEMCFLR
jgi:hypothetical protein